MMKLAVLILALATIICAELDVIHYYSKHGHGHGVSTRFFHKAQGHGYGLGYGGYGGYGGYDGYGLSYRGYGLGRYGGLGYGGYY